MGNIIVISNGIFVEISNILLYKVQINDSLFLQWYIKNIFLFQICCNSHEAEKWCSQPVLNRGLHAGDLMLSASILFSGNNFSKIELFARFLKLAFPGQSTFTRLQKRYLVPAVDELWTAKQTTIVEELTHQDLVILGKIYLCLFVGGCINIIRYAFIEICSPEIL